MAVGCRGPFALELPPTPLILVEGQSGEGGYGILTTLLNGNRSPDVSPPWVFPWSSERPRLIGFAADFRGASSSIIPRPIPPLGGVSGDRQRKLPAVYQYKSRAQSVHVQAVAHSDPGPATHY